MELEHGLTTAGGKYMAKYSEIITNYSHDIYH